MLSGYDQRKPILQESVTGKNDHGNNEFMTELADRLFITHRGYYPPNK